MTTILIEACVDSVAGAIAAEQGGAQRVELCAGLMEGGLTPSAATIELARQRTRISLHVMIRPHGGDFCYTPLELEVMLHDISVAKSLGADGVVMGVLDGDGSVDSRRMATLIAAARPMSVTFHRAFDMVADPLIALRCLIDLGVERVLTSGLEATAVEGTEIIAQLVAQAGERIIVMAGSGITERNIARVVRMTGVHEVHISARSVEDSPMTYRNARVHMGASLNQSEYIRLVTSSDRIRAGIAALTEAGL
jgi:copper homeostasis protein